MTDRLETSGPFVRLNNRVWVRGDAIVVIRTRTTSEGEGSEVVVRAMTPAGSTSAYSVWTDTPAAAIMAAVVEAQGS